MLVFKRNSFPSFSRFRGAALTCLTAAVLATSVGCNGLGGLQGLIGLGSPTAGAVGGVPGTILAIFQFASQFIIDPTEPEVTAPFIPRAGIGFILDQHAGHEASGEALFNFEFPPSAGAVGPDGNIYFCEKGTGRVRVFNTSNNSSPAEPILDLAVNRAGHRGLKGICFAPDGGRLFVTYTASTTGADSETEAEGLENRISSFPFGGSAITGSETILRAVSCRSDLYASDINTIGHCHIGPDDKLYFSHGDLDARLGAQGRSADASAGRIMRLELDGTIPADNPLGTDNPTFQLGLRNPLSFAFDFDDETDTVTIWSTDQGSVVSDELNSGGAGDNFGWPFMQGNRNTDAEGIYGVVALGGFTNPRIDFGQNAKDPLGVLVLRDSLFGGEDVEGHVLVIETVSPHSIIYRYDFSSSLIVQRNEFFRTAVESGRAVDLFEGPDGALWLLTQLHLYRLSPV